MNRRSILMMIACGGITLPAATVAPATVRGKLQAGPDAAIDGVALTGDDATKGVLGDPRLNGSDFEAVGHFIDPKHFEVAKIHTRSLFVHKDGKRLMVTYWCDVCYIRTYTPGKCWCCQKDTDLDLRDSLTGE